MLASTTMFQSPSLRGSGRFVDASSLNCRNVSFQSPSLRGSGRFRSRGPFPNATLSSFNPLHCGAVVASQARRSASLRACACFNPLHCGAVVASSVRSSTRWAMLSFNPLHCGAVVASFLQWRRSSPRSPRFNPLHCGAVVASWTTTGHRHRTCRVSIPFIAGQWSLRAACRRRPAAAQRVSIPFIAGQWSLPDGVRCGECVACRSFNPLHCGAVVASWTTTGHRHRTCRVSIPFIAGQWSLHQQMGGDGH